MIPFWFILKLLNFLRVPAEEETLGLDESYHGGHAYPGTADYEMSNSKDGGNGKGFDTGVPPLTVVFLACLRICLYEGVTCASVHCTPA